MSSSKKRIIAIGGLLFMSMVFLYWVFPRDTTSEYGIDPGYLYDKSHNITYEDVKKARQPLPRHTRKTEETDGRTAAAPQTATGAVPREEIDIRLLFSEALINSYTTARYFKHLENRFKDSVNLGDHLEQVRQLLFSEFSESEARQLFETYEKYIETEIALADQFRQFGLVRTPEDALEILRQIQEFRRARLGEELADQLFGADVKAREYAFRRAAIVGDADLYGPEKETLLEKLNEDMWGDEAGTVESHPNAYTRYREKLSIYEKDLSETPSEETRLQKIREFRQQFFPPEAVERLEDVDRQIARERQQETLYREKASLLLENPDLTGTDREQKLRQLQDEVFGEQAEAFRRSETMRIEREKMMQEYEGKGLQSR